MKEISINHQDVLGILPDREPEGHKGSYGKILLLCGSRGYTGAAYLSAMGALRSGAGLVFLGVPESIYAIEAVKLNEAVVFPLPDEDGRLAKEALSALMERIKDMDAILIGCGLGQSKGVWQVIQGVLELANCPIVVDADGINLLAQHKDVLRGRQAPTILTPHLGEYRRLCGSWTGSAQEFAKMWNCILLLKGHRTLITDGATTYRNQTGNPGMAVGGSGDLLAGMITALLGQGIRPLEAAACGAWLHGRAGDLCAEKLGQYGMLPTDMLAVLPRLLK